MIKIRNSSMFLLWAGAAISITEIYTGGMIAPIGLVKGIFAILIGHIIGVGFLSFGGYISFKRDKNAMENVKSSMGSNGVKIIALLNVLQLLGWAAVMIIQGGRALNVVFPLVALKVTVFIMGSLVLIWVYFFNNYSKLINDISVIALFLLSFILFWKIDTRIPVGIKDSMTFALAVEYSIAMAVSWLPLIGDYTKNARNKSGAAIYTFLGYFIGSMLMFTLGLLIAIYTGKDIIDFIATSYIKWLACLVIVLSTITTTFLDIFSAVISSKQIFVIKKQNFYIILYTIVATVIAYMFPIEQYQSFLIIIGSVFVPIYTVIFIDYIFKREEFNKELNVFGLVSAFAGTIVYYYLNKFQFGIPSIFVICIVTGLYFLLIKLFTLGGIKNANKSI